VKNKIAIVGEAWGEQEAALRTPFVGPSGYLLTQMLTEAGIRRADCFLTNVFNLRPERNDVETLCVPKTESTTSLPPLKAGKYLREEYVPELTRLYTELREVQPNLILALGNTAAWALLSNSGISKIRGTVAPSHVEGLGKVLPCYHPSAILREWSLRPVTVLDFMKARREMEFPDVRRPVREVWIEPSLDDIHQFYTERLEPATRLSIDIETSGDQITCIGFAPSPDLAIVIPFLDARKVGNNYWPTIEHEIVAWKYVAKACALPCAKTFQNGMYDITFLWRSVGIPVALGPDSDDTMLLHHCLQPESQKGLGFLGSVYTNEASWKIMRARGKTTIKREE